MRATENGHLDTVRVLLQRGADPVGIRNRSGHNTVDIARITRNNEI